MVWSVVKTYSEINFNMALEKVKQASAKAVTDFIMQNINFFIKHS